MRRKGGLARLLGTTGAACLVSGGALAEVSTDGTLGRRVRLTGPDVEVGAELGRVRGRNLFHSFERFGVGRGGSVTFTGPGGLDNVVSRVTGGEASRIDGTLRSRVPGADVFLVNPSGLVFGPGARLDVPGSFHASTADEVRFADGARFSALDPGGSTLSVAPPEAFGFLGARPGGITVDRAVLEVPRGERLALAGGDITVAAGAAPGAPPPGIGVVRAEAGAVALAALAGSGEVEVGTGRVAGAVSGTVRLTGGATVESSGDGGGSVRVRAGRLVVEGGSSLLADNTGATDAAGGVVVGVGSMAVVDGSLVTADALGAGDAGTVAVRAGDLEIRRAALIGSFAVAGGDAGAVTIEAGRLLAAGDGAASRTGVASAALAGTGDAGTVTVRASSIELRGGGAIGTNTFAAGDAGDVRVEARRLLVAGEGSMFFSSIASDAQLGSSGDAGTVTVRADDLELRAGGVITTATFSAGDAGEVRVEAGRLLASGEGSTLFTGIVSSAEPGSGGTAGTVAVRADDLRLRDGSEISSATFATGDAGRVEVEAGRLLVSGEGSAFFTGITSQAGRGSGGEAGDVEVRAARLTLRDQGSISSSGLGAGRAGDVRLEAGALLVEDAGIFTTGSGAEGGRIDVSADDVAVLDGAEVTSNGIVPVAGASLITVRAPRIALLDGSRVTSLTGDGDPLTGSGEARVLGEVTFISEDSVVRGSSATELAGIENEVGSELALPPGAFVDAEGLLGDACAARRPDRPSSFTRAPRKGGLPPAPDWPLTSTGGAPSRRALLPGPLLRVASAGCAAGG